MNQASNSENDGPICVCVSLGTKKPDFAYDQEEPEDVTKSLMKLAELSLHDFLASEPDIYTIDDLNVRFR